MAGRLYKENYTPKKGAMAKAVEDFMGGSGLTLKELSSKHNVSHFWLQIQITHRLKIHGEISTFISETENGR